jgi:hypothetical protein
MDLVYDAYVAKKDGDEHIVKGGHLKLPDDAGLMAVAGAIENAVERKAVADSGSQVRVVVTRDGEPFHEHVWDHA